MSIEPSAALNPLSGALPLAQAERKSLKAQAHHLDPVVMLGDGGLTQAVLAEVDRSLNAHGLIKVRVGGDGKHDRAHLAAAIAQALGAAVVQVIGKLVVLWRPKPPVTESAAQAKRRAPRAQFKKTLAAKADQKPAAKPAVRVAISRPSPKPAAPVRSTASKAPARKTTGASASARGTATRSAARPAASRAGTARPAAARKRSVQR
jgi:putative YhbY family RNA-binding protein